MRYLRWSLGACLGFCLCCMTGARAQSPATGPVLNLPAKDLAALVESTRSLLQSHLEADKGLCTFIGSWASFAAAMRDKGKPLTEVLTLARQMPEQYVGWIHIAQAFA